MAWCQTHKCSDILCSHCHTTLDVSARCEDEEDNCDAAYALCGRMTAEELCQKLRDLLGTDWGLTHPVGRQTLVITVTRE